MNTMNIGLKYNVIIALILLCSGCNEPSNPNANQQNNTQKLEKQIQELQTQISTLAKQVADIHEIAMSSQRPKSRKLGTLEDFNRGDTIPKLGSDDATVAIIEFSDFECPYCKRFIDQTFAYVDKTFIKTGKAAYYVRDFPLSFHPKARGAAVAGFCANKQQKYWQLRNTFFNNMAKLSEQYYQQVASELQLDMAAFNECLKQTDQSKINEDIALGKAIGVTGTPAFVIGKIDGNTLKEAQLIIGAQPQASFDYVMKQYLAQ
ncbi:DsbA family protein [Thalassotalea sp. HSM 43]|nr:DsbA family protein [Thalassotalea sp. HSM 43]